MKILITPNDIKIEREETGDRLIKKVYLKSSNECIGQYHYDYNSHKWSGTFEEVVDECNFNRLGGKDFRLNEFEKKSLKIKYKMVDLKFSDSLNKEEIVPVKETKIDIFRDEQRIGFTYSSLETFTASCGALVVKTPMEQLHEEIERSIKRTPEEGKKWEEKQMKMNFATTFGELHKIINSED